MRKLLIGLVLSVMATAAQAQWVLVAEGKNGDKIYADPSTKTRKGNIVRMWEIADYAKPKAFGGTPYHSDRVYRQLDCDERSIQLIQLTAFTGQMAAGESIGTFFMPNDKVFVAPDSIADLLLDFACK